MENLAGVIARCVTDLESPKLDIRQQAIENLVNLGSAAVPDLITVMQTQTGRKAWQTASVLAQINDARWIPPMRAMVKSQNITLASVAAAALEQFGAQEVDTLLRALPNAPTLVQMQIASILERLGDKRAVQPLMRLLRKTDSSDLRHVVIHALGTLGDARALPLIQHFSDDDNVHVRKRAHDAITRLREPDQNTRDQQP